MTDTEELEDIETDLIDTDGDETDYQAELLKAQQEANKWKARFKSEKAKEKTNTSTDVNYDETIERKVEERFFFEKNDLAKEFKTEILEIQSKYNMPVNEAYEFYLAKNKPELLLKKNDSSWWVDWITAGVNAPKSIDEMTDEEFKAEWESRKG